MVYVGRNGYNGGRRSRGFESQHIGQGLFSNWLRSRTISHRWDLGSADSELLLNRLGGPVISPRETVFTFFCLVNPLLCFLFFSCFVIFRHFCCFFSGEFRPFQENLFYHFLISLLGRNLISSKK